MTIFEKCTQKLFKHSFPELHLLSALLTSISTHFQIDFSFAQFGKTLMSPSFESQVDRALTLLGRIQLFCRLIMDRKMNSIVNLLRLPKYNPILECTRQESFFSYSKPFFLKSANFFLTSGQNSATLHIQRADTCLDILKEVLLLSALTSGHSHMNI